MNKPIKIEWIDASQHSDGSAFVASRKGFNFRVAKNALAENFGVFIKGSAMQTYRLFGEGLATADIAKAFAEGILIGAMNAEFLTQGAAA